MTNPLTLTFNLLYFIHFKNQLTFQQCEKKESIEMTLILQF